MDNPIQRYAWGSAKAIARLQHRIPSGQPEAELWMGAHPRAPSTVRIGGRAMPLDAAIERWPDAMLGGPPPLPFLVKVLAVERPLSVQVHPDADQAAAGLQREEAAGIPRDARHRNFRDPRAKPELVVALTDFEALCGFRPWPEARELLARLDLPWTDREAAVRALLDPQTAPLAARAVRRAHDALPTLAPVLQAIADEHPGDPGVLFPLLLRHVVLRPGQGLFLPPGQLHCYLRGVAVEVMGNSDNVLRGGLTAKHKDPEALLSVLDRNAPAPRPCEPDADGRWPADTRAFRLRAAHTGVHGPAIVLCTGGGLYLGTHRLASGDSAFVPAQAGRQPLGGNGAGFVVTPG
ncbi:MAG: mannose-6-phosphate isomerase, class I [Deltaproteobacteria bacterium]|nr:MAG: mannose-6-phosphate isomerase, class I [Deltaproteobacteria bacterium]